MVDEKYNLDVERIFSLLNILKKMSDVKSYQIWLNKQHNIKDNQVLFSGYIFFLDVICSELIDTIFSSGAFNLENDQYVYRGSFAGIKLDDIPNTSEKIIFTKNVWRVLKNLRPTRNWNEVQKIFDSDINEIFSPFDKIYTDYVHTEKKISKSEALRLASIIETADLFHDTYDGGPRSYPSIYLDSIVNNKNLEELYIGYTYAIEYLWFLLLGEEKFNNLLIKNLHNAHISFFEEIENEKMEFYQKFVGDDEEIVQIKNQDNLIQIYWECFDRFHSSINEMIIDPIRERIKGESGLLVLMKNFDKSFFQSLLNKQKISDPDYITNDDTLEKKIKKIDSQFYWYHIDVLEADKSVLSGVPAFISVLLGEVEKYKIFKVSDKVEVIRIKHPFQYPIEKDKFDYSYGIFFSLSGVLFADYSGWLIFFRCATDYSGTGGKNHEQAERFITDNVKKGTVVVREFTAELDAFKEFINRKKIPSMLLEIESEANELLEETNMNPSVWITTPAIEQLKDLSSTDFVVLTNQLREMLDTFLLLIPNIPENTIIITKIEEIRLSKDLKENLRKINHEVLPYLRLVMLDEKSKERFEEINTKLERIEDSQKPSIEEKIVISTGIEAFGSGAQHIVEIPIQSIPSKKFKDDLTEKKQTFSEKIQNFVERVKSKLKKKE